MVHQSEGTVYQNSRKDEFEGMRIAIILHGCNSDALRFATKLAISDKPRDVANLIAIAIYVMTLKIIA
ncbi:hypothetical protein WM40_21055 [Robbsia andropogonis]|uniref:Uncharacterized protein n=1 Tax=Robbsia andropogonis TaxID=28092 RepID=A0A0F5JVA6_9BURK|nr:hypothetical protein [Robbsia andropogonis]KKB61803.1 hypothetical protein WM40_21055 [Robbsia andropogonis]